MNYKYDLPNGWRVADAQEYCVKVADGTHDSPKQTEVGKLLVTSKNIVGGRLDLYSAYHISLEDFEEVNRRSKVDRYDVLLSMIGTVGQACLIEEDPDFAIKNVALLKNTDPYKAKWLYFYLTSTQAQFQIKERLRGTTQQYLPLGEIRKFPVPYPENEYELRRVVDILSSLHDKIELNRQINQTLEQVAQAIFKSWFVDFDPVKAKIEAKENGQDPERAAMRTISGKSEEELDQFPIDEFDQIKATAKLFPDELVESELGEIPKGWEVACFSDVANNIREGVEPEQIDPETFYVGLEHIGRKQIFLTDFGFSSEVNSQKSAFQAGDVLFGKLRPYFHKVCMAPKKGICSTDILVLRPNKAVHRCIMLFTAFSENFVEYSNRNSTGTRMPRASWKDMSGYHMVLPTARLLDEFNQIVSPIIAIGLKHVEESRYLAETRDSLLPRLLSGELLLSSREAKEAA